MQVQAESSIPARGNPGRALLLVGLVLDSLGIGYLAGSRKTDAHTPARRPAPHTPAPEQASAQGYDLPESRIALEAANHQERSQLRIQDCEVAGAAIGLAAKDLSEVEIKGLRLQGLRHFPLTAYRKKALFGPATIQAEGLVCVGENGPCLVQTGSRPTLDGTPVPPRDFDPKELHSDGLLGN